MFDFTEEIFNQVAFFIYTNQSQHAAVQDLALQVIRRTSGIVRIMFNDAIYPSGIVSRQGRIYIQPRLKSTNLIANYTALMPYLIRRMLF
jgi:hypothetical protein